MADPITLIGAIASIAGLVDMGAKLCFTLHGMAKVFSSAPETIDLMDRDVTSLRSVLQQLKSEMERGNSHGLDLPRETGIDLQNILESCELVFVSLKTILDKFTNYPKKLEGAGVAVTKINSIRVRFRWMMEEGEVVRIRKSLQTHVQTLQLTLTATTALVVALIRKDTTDIITLLQDLHSNLKRSVTITSETVVGLQVQTPFQSIIHNHSTMSTATQDTGAQIPAAAIDSQRSNTEPPPGPSTPSIIPAFVPTGETDEPGSVQVKPPDLQHDSISRLTVSNQGQRASNRRRPVIAVPGETLFVAARAGNKDIFLRILQTGAKITEVEADGTTVLQAAAEANHLDVVLSLLFFGADPNMGGGRTGSPLIAATYKQHKQIVAALLEAEADPTAFYPEALPFMKSAFHCALDQKNSEILSVLLGVGADLNGVPGLLHYACSVGTLESVKQLLDTKLDIDGLSDHWGTFGTPLQVAVSKSRTDVVRLLLEHQADPNITPMTASLWERSPLFAAVYAKNSENLSLLLGAGADVDGVPGLLHFACSDGTLNSVEQLLETKLDINERSDRGATFGTPLQVAVLKSRTDIVRFLLKHKADPNITSPTSPPWHRSPLFAAAFKNNCEIASMLLGANADPKAVPGLLPYAAQNTELRFVKILVEEGKADIDSVDDNLGTALQVFAAKGQRDALAYLLDLGADPNIRGGRYGSAINAAIANGHKHCTEELLG